MTRVLVAMSGGVDSSVAAARLLQQGYDVVGATLHLWDYPDDGSVKGRCCAPEDVHDARRVADKLGFPHFAFDRRELFEREVVDPFVEEYLAGHAQSLRALQPKVKVRELMKLADTLRRATSPPDRADRRNGAGRTLPGIDKKKDQSYFLHMLTDETLSRLLFPLGDDDKATTRAEAVELGLPGAKKGESQELCFVPTGRYDALVEKRAPERVRPGKIVDAEGRELGDHGGLHQFTRGQRRGLGVAVGQRTYVTRLEAGLLRCIWVPKKNSDALPRSGVWRLRQDRSALKAEVVIRYHGDRCRQSCCWRYPRVPVWSAEPVMAPSVGAVGRFLRGRPSPWWRCDRSPRRGH